MRLLRPHKNKSILPSATTSPQAVCAPRPPKAEGSSPKAPAEAPGRHHHHHLHQNLQTPGGGLVSTSPASHNLNPPLRLSTEAPGVQGDWGRGDEGDRSGARDPSSGRPRRLLRGGCGAPGGGEGESRSRNPCFTYSTFLASIVGNPRRKNGCRPDE